LVCSNCGTETVPGKFCSECGAPLARGCASCGFANDAAAKFCRECGAPFVAAARPSQPQLSELGLRPAALATRDDSVIAELRLVTVLFADLVGVTTRSA
jgi:predicted amidophosphoribosyltransferase